MDFSHFVEVITLQTYISIFFTNLESIVSSIVYLQDICSIKTFVFAELLTEKSGHNNGGVGAGLGSAIATKVTTMTESSSIMTSSLPNMELSNDDLDKLSDRLGKFKSPSRLPKPKPEIQPKPAHLVAQLAKHKVPVPVASPTSPTTLEKG